jgi:hypothetical protein
MIQQGFYVLNRPQQVITIRTSFTTGERPLYNLRLLDIAQLFLGHFLNLGGVANPLHDPALLLVLFLVLLPLHGACLERRRVGWATKGTGASETKMRGDERAERPAMIE